MNVEIDLLGGFAVRVDGRSIPAREWRRRHATSLVKLLALAPRRTLHREQVMTRCGLTPRSTTPARGCTRRRTLPAVRWATRARWSCRGTPSLCFPTPMW